MIFFRADANSQIGVGHMMRCIAIAKRIIEEEVYFVISDSQSSALLEDAGIKYLILDCDYTNMCEEVTKLNGLITQYKANTIVVDSYYVSEEYFNSLDESVKIIYIDDLCNTIYPVDCVINYNISADEENYKNLIENASNTKDGGFKRSPRFFTGLSYVPLRKIFEEKGKTKRHIGEVTDILFTAGGADPLDISIDIAKYWKSIMKSYPGIILHIVCGPMYNSIDSLEQEVKDCNQIEVHVNVKNMAELMDSCQIAIASTGSTIYELCAKGIPTESFYYVENQRLVYEAFVNKTPVTGAGDYSKNPNEVMKNIFVGVDELIRNQEKRINTSNHMKTLVDGNGAKRIAQIIIERD